MIDELFDLARAHWVKYDKYIWKKASDGAVYLTAAEDAMPTITSPLSVDPQFIRFLNSDFPAK